MDIRNISASGLNAPSPIHPASPGEAESTKAGVPAPQGPPSPAPGTEDRLDLSELVRGRLPNTARGREIAFARKALDALPPLSEERLAKIRDRMENGFYSRTDVLHKIAGRIADEVTGLPPQTDDRYPPGIEEA